MIDSSNDEKGPGWPRVTLKVNPNGEDFYVIDGDRKPGEGDRSYLAIDPLMRAIQNKAIQRLIMELDRRFPTMSTVPQEEIRRWLNDAKQG